VIAPIAPVVDALTSAYSAPPRDPLRRVLFTRRRGVRGEDSVRDTASPFVRPFDLTRAPGAEDKFGSGNHTSNNES